MKTYLINVVLDTSVSSERLILPDRRTCAIVIGILYILPLTILHLWDYYKLSLDVVYSNDFVSKIPQLQRSLAA
eukprot:g21300.t1